MARSKSDGDEKFPAADPKALTELEAAYVSHVANGMNGTEAAAAAGYAAKSAAQEAYRLNQRPRVIRAIFDARQRLIVTQDATLARKTMLALMAPEQPPGVRFQAARYTLDAAGHGAANKGADPDEPADMTGDQLRAMMAAAQKIIEEADRPIGDREPDEPPPGSLKH